MVKEALKRLRPVEFARRVEVIPFVTLTSFEQRVITLQEQDVLTSRYVRPISGKREIGNILYHFYPNFTQKIVQGYDPLEGATSLKNPIKMQIDTIVLEAARAETSAHRHEHAYFWVSKYDAFQSTFEPPKNSELFVEGEMKSDGNSSNVTEDCDDEEMEIPASEFTHNFDDSGNDFGSL